MTALAPNNRRKYFAVVTILAAAFLLGVILWARQNGPEVLTTVEVRGKTFRMEMVNTPESQRQGLSGRETIDEDYVMVFPATEVTNRCFWMKDMNFNIDIVWLDEATKVVAIEHDVSPKTYPNSFCHDGKNVLEFKAGTAKNIDMQVGDQVWLTSML